MQVSMKKTHLYGWFNVMILYGLFFCHVIGRDCFHDQIARFIVFV